MSFRGAGPDAEGAFRADVLVRPFGRVGSPHVHDSQEERVQVLAGRLRYRLGRDELPLGERQTVSFPPGVAHAWWNDGDADAHVVVELRPARDAALLFETLFARARERRTDERGMPGLIDRARLAREHGFFAAGLPVVVQRPLLALLATFAGGARSRGATPR